MMLEQRFLSAKRACFERLYAKLNKKQREAVFSVNGPLLVLAGAGSGKTTVLVHRIAHIIRYGNAYLDTTVPDTLCDEEVEFLEKMASGEYPLDAKALERYAVGAVPPYSVLSITFTNKAANSMKQKLEKALGEKANEIWAGTFHSICAKILRRESEKIGFNRDFAIYDTDDTKKLVTECEKELDISTDKFPAKAVQNLISKTKDKLVSAEEFSEKAGNDYYLSNVAKIFELYEKKLQAANAMDFDDLIGKTVKLFTDFPDVLEFYQRKFKYVLVDEYQDTNHAQFILVSKLAAGYGNLMVVGDDDQSIYSFRGATIDNILTFDKSFAKTKVVKLEQNYRSTSNILGAANSLIAKNHGRYGKTLWSDGEGGMLPTVAEVDDQNAEVRYIANIISEKVADGAKFSDFAILYRMNAQSAGFETIFAKSAIPYRMLCGIRFYERAEVKDIVAYMQLIANPKDDTRLMRIINVPRRGIGDSTVDAVAQIAAYEKIPMLEVIRKASSYEALARASEKLGRFAEFIDKMKAYAESLPLNEFAEKLVNESGYIEMLLVKGEEGIEKIENLKALVNNVALHLEANPEATLSSFLEEVSLIADIDNYDDTANAVTMMTIHSAKGLEFPTVFIPGMEEGIFPGNLVVSETEVEEERRLAYVALTRAEKELYITHARSRMLYGRTNSNRVSRFVTEIGSEYKNEISLAKAPRFHGGYGYSAEELPWYKESDFSANYTARKKVPERKPIVTEKKVSAPVEVFSVGDTVIHKIFGDGLVLSVTNMGGDTLYEVAFDKAGTKKLMGTYAKLKRK